jgi:hypothetical protein
MLAVRIPEPYFGSSVKRALVYIKRCINRLRKGKSLSEEEQDRFWQLHCDLANRKYHSMAETLCHVYYDMSNDSDAEILRKLCNLQDMLDTLNQRRKRKVEVRKAGIAKQK